MPIGETRRFKRIPVNVPIAIGVHESMAQEVHPKKMELVGQLADISRGGCSVMAETFLPRGTLVKIHVDKAPFAMVPGSPVDVTGKIVMVRMVARKQYKLGVEFAEIASELRDAIGTFCGD